MAKLRRIKAKKSCCLSSPRCKRCPLVLKRLEKAGCAIREDKRTFIVIQLSKGDLRRARKR